MVCESRYICIKHKDVEVTIPAFYGSTSLLGRPWSTDLTMDLVGSSGVAVPIDESRNGDVTQSNQERVERPELGSNLGPWSVVHM